ncbi:Bbp16 family capsid cement protein [Burkholderia seminalis]|uniref:Bbp16 family capsid cement protein n=1 Tax=Burkholderia seminalis TaxID=488731 RepID=UPI001454A3CE|nr:hypothetical protein [Burkholderia seminalis]MCA8429352.1 hypothetical protein [Burkholderia seminalis]VWC10280.1 hypothetical protein BSE24067_05317 [Burkholderia seminalis]
MILDASLIFDTGAAITSTTLSTNVIDLSGFRDLGVDGGRYSVPKLMCLVTTAFVSTNATLQASFQGSTDNSTWTTYASSAAVPAAALIAGARPFDLDLPRPPAGVAFPRYLRLLYTVGIGVFSAGAVTSTLVLGREDHVVNGAYQSGYAPGFTVSN